MRLCLCLWLWQCLWLWPWLCLWHAYVGPWHMLNNFCFHVYAQKWIFVIMSHVTFRICHMLHVTCCMSYVKCLCWSLGHAEQLLFSCVSSKVSICNYVTCHISPFTCHMLYVKCLCWSLGHAAQLLFSWLCSKVSIYNYITCHMSHFACHMSHCLCHMSHVLCQVLMLILGTCWTTFVFMCKL